MFSILFALAISVTIADATASSIDSAALLRLKNDVGDPLGTLNGWNKSVNYCEWEGVDCSAQQGRVIGLRLQSLTLPSPDFLLSRISKLPDLRKLHVAKSQFTEPLSINSSLPGCGLEVLGLSQNRLHGNFPIELAVHCKDSLSLLNLSYNQLGGELGADFRIGSILEAIDLSNNNFTGTISSSLFQGCNSLSSFNLSNNGFSGSVPQEIVTSCPILEHVDLASNNFSGVLNFRSSTSIRRLNLASNSLSKITIACLNLTHLDVSYNRLSGKILSSSNSTCSSLKVLNISSNFFSGPLSSSSVLGLMNLESLEVLDASYNLLANEVPGFHANLKHLDLSSNMFSRTSSNVCPTDSQLESLLLPNNRLTGPVFDSLLNCGSLKMLDLSFNDLHAEIPEQLCSSLPKLQNLLAWGNGLQGAIPSTLGNCINLVTLILSHNNLNGTIPPQLSSLNKLWWLGLSSNNLTGKIPSSFGELDNLVCLQMNNNSLEGEIPKEMDGSKSLRVIELTSNSLRGKLPGRIGRKFIQVEAAGVIPVEPGLGSVRVARTPSLLLCKGSNILYPVQGIRLHDLETHLFARTGCFLHLNLDPPYVLNISSPIVVELSYNELIGEIPEEIGLMGSLLFLNVAHNKLSGPIPRVLGNLKEMQFLDLSQNALEGSIPDSLSQLTYLFHFNVSYNNLSGLIPQTGQFLTFTARSYQGNPDLCGLPLPIKCSAAGLPVLSGTTDPVGDGGIQINLVVALVSGTMAFIICGIFTLYCSSKWKAVSNFWK